MSRPIRLAAVFLAAVPPTLTSHLWTQSCGWFAYQPPPMPSATAVAAWRVLNWATLLLPALLAAIALWAPGRLPGFGGAVTALVLALDFVVPVVFPETGQCGIVAQIHWDRVACHTLTLVLLVLARRFPAPAWPRGVAAAWSIAFGVASWALLVDDRFLCDSGGMIPGWYATVIMYIDPYATWPIFLAVAALMPGGWVVAGIALLLRALMNPILDLTSDVTFACAPLEYVAWPYLVAALVVVIPRSADWVRTRRYLGDTRP